MARLNNDIADDELLRPSPALRGKSNLVVNSEDIKDLFGEGGHKDEDDDDVHDDIPKAGDPNWSNIKTDE